MRKEQGSEGENGYPGYRKHYKQDFKMFKKKKVTNKYSSKSTLYHHVQFEVLSKNFLRDNCASQTK